VLQVQVPFLFKHAIDTLAGDHPTQEMVLYGMAATPTTLLLLYGLARAGSALSGGTRLKLMLLSITCHVTPRRATSRHLIRTSLFSFE
jgi:hypothetical protein